MYIYIPDKGVDVLGLDVVQRLHGVLDLTLVRLHVHDKPERVVVLDHLHRALGRQWELDDPVLVHPGRLLPTKALRRQNPNKKTRQAKNGPAEPKREELVQSAHH